MSSGASGRDEEKGDDMAEAPSPQPGSAAAKTVEFLESLHGTEAYLHAQVVRSLCATLAGYDKYIAALRERITGLQGEDDYPNAGMWRP